MNVDPILSLLALDYSISLDKLKSLGSGQLDVESLASESTSALKGAINSMSEDELAEFDEDGNEKLEGTELKELISFIFAQGLISETLFNSLLSDIESQSTQLSLNNETSTNAALSTDTQTQDEMLQIYNQKLEYANNLINNDEKIPNELITQRSEVETKLAEISEQIEKLNLNFANLTAEELAQLEALKTQKEELIKQRDAIEEQILAVCSEDTKQAILEMQQARNNVNAAAPQTSTTDPTTAVPPTEDSAVVSKPAQTNSAGGAGGGTGGGGGGDDKVDVKDGGYDNMSVEELNAELTKANTDLGQKQASLSAILDGSDPALSGLKTTMDEAYKSYQDILKTVAPQLADALDGVKTQLDAKQVEIDNKNLEISNQNTEISKCQTSYDNATSTVGEYESIIASLESASSKSDNAEDKGEIATKLSTARAALEKAKQAQTAAETALGEAQGKLTTMQGELDTLNAQKTELQTQMTAVEAQITALNNEEVNTAMSAYNTAKQQYETTKQTMTTTAQGEVKTAQEVVSKIETALNAKNNQAARSELSFSSLGGTYNLNGVEYTTLLDSAELKQLSSRIQAGGAGNKWGHPDKCLSFAYSYGMWINGKTATPINGRAAEYPDAGSYTDLSGSQDEMLSIVKEQLDKGIPVVLQVNGNRAGDSRHYVTVVGYRAGAGKLTQNDLLILDTYDGLIEGMGTRGSRFMISGKATGRKYDYQIYVRKGG